MQASTGRQAVDAPHPTFTCNAAVVLISIVCAVPAQPLLGLQELLQILHSGRCSIQQLDAVNNALLRATNIAVGSIPQPSRNQAERTGMYRKVFGTRRANQHSRAQARTATQGTGNDEREFSECSGPSMERRVRERKHQPLRKRATIMHV